jgi:DNA polymerase III delta subunit
MITTLSGSNHFMLQARLQSLVADYLKAYGDMGLQRLDGEEAGFEQIQEAILSLPFLSPKKLVVVTRGSANAEFAAALIELLPKIDDSTDVILVEPKLDKRQSYYKTLKAQTNFEEFSELEGPELARWLVQVTKDLGGTLALADANKLIHRVGSDQQLLHNELIKLIHYDKNVSADNIAKLTEVTPQSSIFDLIEAAVGGNTARALELYDEQRKLRVEPPQVIAMFVWQLHLLALIKAAGPRSPADIAKAARISPYSVSKSQNLSRRLSSSELNRRIEALLQIDVASKSSALDTDQAMRHYILTWNQAISS